MIEVKGKYNEAKIFTDVVDNASVSQVIELCNQEFAAGSRIRLMPDIHAGMGCTVGTTMTITDKVVPNLVGVDIGCGMEIIRIRESYIEPQKLDKLIYEKIPAGFAIRSKPHRYLDEVDLDELCCIKHIDLPRAEKSIGTLGGGNHFIEADKDDKSISVVEALHIRDREFESFAFRINDECLPETVEFYQPQKRQEGRTYKEPFDP